MSGTRILSYLILTISIIYAFTLPLASDLSVLLDRKADLQEELNKANDIENKKITLLADFDKISVNNVRQIENLIPDSLDFVKLVADVDAIASKYGISIDRAASVDTAINVGSVAEAENLSKSHSAVITFEFSASYTKFNDFLNDLERSLRILDVKSVQITTGEKLVYRYKVEFETYWSN